MQISFGCPACNVKVKGDESFAGRVVKCPNCKKDITVPSVQPPLQLPQDQPLPTPAVATMPTAMPPQAMLAEHENFEGMPWFYGFLYYYSCILMIGGMIVAAVMFMLGVKGLSESNAGERFSAAISILGGVVFAIGTVTTVCWSFLLIDLARNVRLMRVKDKAQEP